MSTYLTLLPDQPIAAGVLGNSFSINIDWQPLSKHTYRLVPYNKLGQKGTEKTVELTVDDYEATVDLLDAEYVPQKNQIRINWSGSNVRSYSASTSVNTACL